jgi:hypothetical protein
MLVKLDDTQSTRQSEVLRAGNLVCASNGTRVFQRCIGESVNSTTSETDDAADLPHPTEVDLSSFICFDGLVHKGLDGFVALYRRLPILDWRTAL